MDVIVTDRCQGCGACLLTCPEHAVRPRLPAGPAGDGLGGGPHAGPLRVVDELCTGCLECVDVCPVDAIEFRVRRGEEGT
ncbi:MAG TPA: 4Fe-4S dicluster domain-containing protein [Streptosporangiaceae bacterium]|nr:4Fe-4S dicluster domain-containing protein [Streptosporangiaceae bacterium]